MGGTTFPTNPSTVSFAGSTGHRRLSDEDEEERIHALSIGTTASAAPVVGSASFSVKAEGLPRVGAVNVDTTAAGRGDPQNPARRVEDARRRAIVEEENPFKGLAAWRTVFWEGKNFHLKNYDANGNLIAYNREAWDRIEHVFIEKLNLIKQNNPNAINAQEVMDFAFDMQKNQTVLHTGPNGQLQVIRSAQTTNYIGDVRNAITNAGSLPDAEGNPSRHTIEYQAGKKPRTGLIMERPGTLMETYEKFIIGHSLSSSDLSNYMQIMAETHKRKRTIPNPFKPKPSAPYQLAYSTPLEFNDSFKKTKQHFFDIFQAEIAEMREEDRKKHLYLLPIQTGDIFSAVILDLETNKMFYFSPSQAAIDQEIDVQLIHMMGQLNNPPDPANPWTRDNIFGNHPAEESGFQILDAMEKLLDQPVNERGRPLVLCLRDCAVAQDPAATQQKYDSKAAQIKAFDPSALEPAKEKFWHKIPLINQFANR